MALLNRKLKRLKFRPKKSKKFKIIARGSKNKNLYFFFKKINKLTFTFNLVKKKAEPIKIKKKKTIGLDDRGCFANWLLKQSVSNCRWRIFLRSRWVAGKRMKVPFFTTFVRDARYACKNFVKSITDKKETPFLPSLLKEIYLSLVLRSATVKKRILAYRTVYTTSLYTSGNFKTVRRRKRINRY